MQRLALVAALAASSLALAEDRPSLAVIDLEAKNGASASEAQICTLGVARGLRDLDVFSIISSDDTRKLLDLERTRVMAGDDAGQTALAAQVGARYVVAGTVARLGGSVVQVELRLLDSQASKVLAQKTSKQEPSIAAAAQDMVGLSQELVAPLLRDQQGSLLVTGREEGAEVLVDDALVASLPMQSAVKLSRGLHRLQVRRDGFITLTKSIRIEQNQLTVEPVVLAPSPDFAQAYQKRNGRLRLAAWLTTGIAVAALAGSFAMDRLVTQPQYENEFLPRQAALLHMSFYAPLDSNPAASAAYSKCDADPATCRTDIEAVAAGISTQQTVETGMVIVGLVAAGAASYLWINGDDPNRYTGLVAGLSLGSGHAGVVLGGHF